MKVYKGLDIAGIPTGWYWAIRMELPPEPIRVSTQESLTVLGFGYNQEVYIYRDAPQKSDYHENVTLMGTMEVPKF